MYTERTPLVGRSEQQAKILAAFELAARGTSNVVVLAGESGVGKTSLARWSRRHVTARNGYFFAGKFDQFNQHTPLQGWTHLLRAVHAELESDQAPTDRQAMLTALRGRGQLLVSLVPEFTSVLGPQPALPPLNPIETRHRFLETFEAFFGALCSAEHPVTLFMDDVQWADEWSFDLLERLVTLQPYLLCVTSYRSGEMPEGRSFLTRVRSLSGREIPVTDIVVPPLRADDADQLLRSVGADDQPRIREAAQGNPFLLLGLADLTHHGDRGSTPLPTDAVELMALHLRRLDPPARDLLSVAACVGHTFDIRTLSMVSGLSEPRCREKLLRADALVQPTETDRFSFVHDRAQQAAHARMDRQARASTHRRIALTLWSHLSPAQREDRACELADHFSAGLAELTDEECSVAVEVAQLAARRARQAGAYPAAVAYHRSAQRCLTRPGVAATLWADRYHLVFGLQLEHAESEFLTGNPELANQLVRGAAARARSVYDQVDALVILIQQLTVLAAYPEAITVGREALVALEMPLPLEDFDRDRDEALAACRASEGSDLTTLPIAADVRVRSAAKVLIALGPPCYRSHAALWSVIVPRVVALIRTHGLLAEAMYALPAMVGLQHWLSRPTDGGVSQYAVPAIAIAARPWVPDTDRSVFWLMIGSSARHWFAPLSEATRDYETAALVGRESGNLQYAAYAMAHDAYCRYFAGTDLALLDTGLVQALDFAETRRNQWAIDLLTGVLRVVRELQGSAVGSPEDEYLEGCTRHGNEQVVCIYSILRAQAQLLLGDRADARRCSDRAEASIHMVGTQGLLPWTEHLFVRALLSDSDEEIAAAAERFAEWSRHSPSVFAHKEALLRAECARRTRRFAEALAHLERSAEAARAAGALQWEGYANESAARQWADFGSSGWQVLHWQNAHESYGRWGARSKQRVMDTSLRRDLGQAYAAVVDMPSTGVDLIERRLAEAQRRSGSARTIERMTGQLVLAEQLAEATGTLRVDVADHRRENVELLRREREQRKVSEYLERQVADRTRALHERQQQLRAFLDNFPFPMWMKDRGGTLLAANLAYARWAGLSSADEVNGRTTRDLFPADIAERLDHSDQQVADSGETTQHEHQELDEAGGPRWTESWRAPIKVGTDVIGVVGYVRDITALRAAEADRRRLAAIVDTSSDAIFSRDLDGKILTWNRGAELLFGYSAAEAVGSTEAQLLSLPDFGPEDATVKEHLAQGLAVAPFDAVWRCKDGTRIDVSVRRSHLASVHGEVVGDSTIARDVRVLRRNAKALEEANQRLERSNHDLEQFAYVASHDLQEPLRMVANYTELLATRYRGQLDEKADRYIAYAVDGARRMQILVSDLLSYSRIGSEVGRTETVDVDRIVRGITTDLRDLPPDCRIDVDDLPRAVGDPTQLSQLFRNLIGNAVKFRSTTRPLHLEIRGEPVGADRAEFVVRDNGIGLDMRYADRIFLMFQRLHTRSEFEGSGIGLAIAKRVVERHGGTIRVASVLGEGTSFVFSLPSDPRPP